MIGYIVQYNGAKRLLLLKAGECYIQREISDDPVCINNIINQIGTDHGPMYLGQHLYFGKAEAEVIAIADEPESVTLALLADSDVCFFVSKLAQKWSSGDAPAYAKDCLDDLINYVKWYRGEVDYLSRATETPC